MTGSLVGQYKTMHEAGKFAGLSVVQHAEQIKNLIYETDSESVLDYGCGKGHQYSRHGIHEEWGIDLRLYDPAVPGFTSAPKPADGVICCDVMEHIPEHEVRGVIKAIMGLAKKFVFFVVCTRASKKFLPDGQNCHVTIKPRDWWTDAIDRERKKTGTGARIVVEFRDGL